MTSVGCGQAGVGRRARHGRSSRLRRPPSPQPTPTTIHPTPEYLRCRANRSATVINARFADSQHYVAPRRYRR